MRFTVEGKELNKALLKLKRLVGELNTVILSVDVDNVLNINTANTLLCRATFRMSASATKPGRVMINSPLLESACKNRSSMSFVFNDAGMHFNEINSKYSGSNIAVIPDTGAETMPFTTNRFLDNDLQGRIVTAIQTCLIKPIFSNETLALSLILKGNTFIVAVADSYHGAVASFPVSKQDVETLANNKLDKPIVLPIDYAEIITSQFNTDGLKISATSNKIILANTQVKIELPAMAIDQSAIDEAIIAHETLAKRSYAVDAKTLQNTLTNISGLSQVNNPILFKLLKGKSDITVEFASGHGNISDKINLHKDSNPVGINLVLPLEPKNCMDIARKLDGIVRLGHNDYMIAFTCKKNDLTVRYYSTLITPDN